MTRDARATELLTAVAGPTASFRAGQLESILALVEHRARLLLVQRTGWGKSAVYFIATRLLREGGAGPTLLISPLLALMRNQILMAERAGVHASTINSANRDGWVPVLGTTATANDRVIADIGEQLDLRLAVHRGPLARESLRLFVAPIADQAQRLAWLATYLPGLPGSGIVYCLTVAVTRRLAAWLRGRGIDAAAYYGALDADAREDVERRLLDNDVKVVVATSALGMGFDKPDWGSSSTSRLPDRSSPTTSRSAARAEQWTRPLGSCSPAPRTPTSKTTSSKSPSHRATRQRLWSSCWQPRRPRCACLRSSRGSTSGAAAWKPC
ncbi:MAG TPA: helicase-related protein [Egibacteraceae bacterium]|nr:helicase-related protein [Egibacteraceae bacterium]